MKSNVVIYTIITIYFVIIASLYTLWNFSVHQRIEWAGTVGIFGSGALGAFMAGYLALTMRKQGGKIVADVNEADIDDADPEIGEFSPWSWWPFMLAFSVALFIVGVCIGFKFWLAVIALPLVIIGVIGWIFEYYRGNFAR